jgi:hypothetical protein
MKTANMQILHVPVVLVSASGSMLCIEGKQLTLDFKLDTKQNLPKIADRKVVVGEAIRSHSKFEGTETLQFALATLEWCLH